MTDTGKTELKTLIDDTVDRLWRVATNEAGLSKRPPEAGKSWFEIQMMAYAYTQTGPRPIFPII